MENINNGTQSDSCSGLTVSERMKLSSLTYEIIEELRMRRVQDVDNEKRIQMLLQEKFTMGWHQEQQVSQLSSCEERRETELRELRRHMEDKMRQAQVEATQQLTYRKMAEKEKEAFKEEIRKVQLANYGLEKKLRECESVQRTLTSEREQHMAQLAMFETQSKQLEQHVTMVTNKQDKLEGNMKQVRDLNQKLLYQNTHQKCVLEMKTEEIVQLRDRLHDTCTQNKLEPRVVAEREAGLQGQIGVLKETVQKLEDQYETLLGEKEDWKGKYWGSLKQLDDAHRLLNVHLHNAAQYRKESITLETSLTHTKTQLDMTETTLAGVQQQLDETTVEKEQDVLLWKQKEETFIEEARELTNQVESKDRQVKQLETEVSEISSEKESVQRLLDDALIVLNVERCPCEVQTVTSMMLMTDTETQVSPDIQNKPVQCTVSLMTSLTQTVHPALANNSMQTEPLPTPAVVTMETQTPSRDLQSVEIQTEHVEHLQILKENISRSKPDTLTDKIVALERHAQTFNSLVDERDSSSIAVKSVIDSTINSRELMNQQPLDEEITDKDKEEMAIGITGVKDDCPFRGGTFQYTDQSQRSNAEIAENNAVIEAQYLVSSANTEKDGDVIKHAESLSLTRTGQSVSMLDDPCETTAESSNDTLNTAIQSDVLNVGLTVPKIDVSGVIANIHTAVDPDDFEVQLTQDADNVGGDRVEKDLTQTNDRETSLPCEKGDAEQFIGGVQNMLGKELMKGSTETTKKSKPSKHKLLTKDFVTDQFTNFDAAREEFEAIRFKPLNDCSRSKQRKLTSMFGGNLELEQHQDSNNHPTQKAVDSFHHDKQSISIDSTSYCDQSSRKTKLQFDYRDEKSTDSKADKQPVRMSSSERLLFNIMHGGSPSEGFVEVSNESQGARPEIEAGGEIYISETSDADSSPLALISDDQQDETAELNQESDKRRKLSTESLVLRGDNGKSLKEIKGGNGNKKVKDNVPVAVQLVPNLIKEAAESDNRQPTSGDGRCMDQPSLSLLPDKSDVHITVPAVSVTMATVSGQSSGMMGVTSTTASAGPKVSTSKHILQTYRDIVSKISSVQQPLFHLPSSKAASSHSSNVPLTHSKDGKQPRARQISSQMLPNPKSILKGVKAKPSEVRTKSVSWNETVHQTDFNS